MIKHKVFSAQPSDSLPHSDSHQVHPHHVLSPQNRALLEIPLDPDQNFLFSLSLQFIIFQTEMNFSAFCGQACSFILECPY